MREYQQLHAESPNARVSQRCVGLDGRDEIETRAMSVLLNDSSNDPNDVSACSASLRLKRGLTAEKRSTQRVPNSIEAESHLRDVRAIATHPLRSPQLSSRLSRNAWQLVEQHVEHDFIVLETQ